MLGYVMRNLGFPLAPMILGVVLGNIAELNLSRAFAITTDLEMFVVRPWSLFFIILAVFSVFFPRYQKLRGRRKWTLAYLPALLAALSVPMVMMGGITRPLIAAALLITAGYTIWRHARAGWRLETGAAPEVHIEETESEEPSRLLADALVQQELLQRDAQKLGAHLREHVILFQAVD